MFTIINAASSFAGPARTTYQAKIVKPDGYPLEASNVNFKFTILDPAGTCILYSETYSSVNMGNTGGLISFSLGSGVKTYPASATTFEQVFSNITANLSCDAGGPVHYSPSANDSRKIVMQFHDGTGWQTLPAMAINAVPYAMYANEASKLDGKVASDFVQNSSLATCGAGEALSFNGATFSCLTVPVPQAVSGAAVVTALGYTPADGASVTSLSTSLASANATISAVSSTVASVSSTVASVSSTVFSVSSTVSSLSNTVTGLSTSVSNLSASMAAITSSQWVTSGTTIFYNSGYVGIGTSAPSAAIGLNGNSGQTIGLERADSNSGQSLNIRAGSAALGSTDMNGGPLFLSAGISTGMGHSNIIFRTASGTISGSSDNALVNRMVISGNGNIGIGTSFPGTKLEVVGGLKIGTESATCAASLAGTLRYNGGAVEYCNGTTWAAFGVSGAGLQSLNGSTSGTQSFTVGTTGTTLNIASTNGVHTFNIPLASAGSVTGGLLSNADYTTFMGKITSSAASIAQVLGYAPVSTTTLGNYAVRANNLSDLTSSATARTNLGLGTFATASSIDLGSASATGTLAAARLPSFAGDVTSVSGSNTLTLANSGVSAATYTKVIVNSKGLVTSGSQLTSSDVTTALGFTPGAAASGVTLLNGSASQTQTFAIGTTGTTFNVATAAGVHTFNIPLASTGAVTGGLLSNADYTTFMGKITSSAASIAQVLGYTPASATSLGNYLVKANNLSDLTSSATARTNLGLGTFATANSIDLGSASATGILDPARLPAHTGDVTSVSGSQVLTLASVGTGITSGSQYTKVTVDGKGRVVSGALLTSSDVTTALGFTPGAAASGVTLLNGSASQTQTFANGTAGTAPAFVTANGVHTLNIPLASAASVTGGLLSNADYTTFVNYSSSLATLTANLSIVSSTKITSSAASIAQVLGYVPASASASGNYLVKTNNLSDLTSSATARINLGLGSFATANTVDLGSASATGTLDAARLPAFSGDASSVSGSPVLTLASVGAGVTSGSQYTKVTVDGKGRVVSGAQLNVGDVTTALGYTPASASASTQWVTSATAIYYNTGNVGIGTADPQGPLHILSSSPNAIVLERSNANNSHIQYKNTAGFVYAGLNTSGSFAIGPNVNLSSSPFMTVQSGTGFVGIGTSAPYAKLHVSASSGTSETVAISLYSVNSASSGLAAYGIGMGPTGSEGYVTYRSGTGSSALYGHKFFVNDAEVFRINGLGNVGVGISSPSARLHLPAATSSTASLKLVSGTLLSSAQAGAVEYDGYYYYITDGTNTRRTIATVANPGTFDNASTITSTGNITMVPVGSVVVSSTTAATNSSTGALIVKGGLGVAGNIYSSGTIVTSSDIYGSIINATSATITPYIYGSTQASGNLRIDSTSHTTKGTIYLAPNGGFVEIGTNSAVGVSSPSVRFVQGGGDQSALRITNNSVANWIQSGVDYSSDSKKDIRFSSINAITTWMTIQASSGNLGVGTSSPASKFSFGASDVTGNTHKMAVYETSGSGTYFYGIGMMNPDGLATGADEGLGLWGGTENTVPWNGSSGTAAHVFIKRNTGNVGIGNTNPGAKLHVSGNQALENNTNSSGGSSIAFWKNRNYGATQNNDELGYLSFYGHDGTGTQRSAFIISNAEGAPMTGSVPGNIRFMTTDLGSADSAERMRITASGSVGIATTSPSEKLDVNGNLVVRGANIYTANDGAANTNNDYINYDDNVALGTGGVWSFNTDTARGVSWTAATAAIAAKAAYVTSNVSIGTSAQTRTLEVNGSINAAGMASEVFSFTVDGTSSGTWAIGSLSNTGQVVHVNFEMFVHNNSTIDALRFQASLPTYSNGTFYSNWQELPVAFGSTAWNGQKNYVIDVLRSSSSAGQPIYFRVRNKNGNGSSSTMKIRMTYNSDITFTRITHVNTVATAFNAGTAAAGGPVDGMYGALEYSFPVAIGQAWRPADNSGLFVKNSGYVGIGTSNPSVELEVSGTVKAQAYLYTSDRRLKKDIVTLPDALEKVLKMRGVNFVWRNTEEKTVGFIAQEVEEVYPELVKTDARTGFKAVQYGNIVAILVEAIKQENKERVEAQNQCEVQLAEVKRSVASVEEKSAERMNKLEKENQDLKSRLEKLEKLLLKK